MKWFRVWFGIILVVTSAVAAAAVGAASMAGDWRTASRQPAGLAPDAATTPEAVVQVYVARAFGWRGAFGVHSWVAVKPTKAPHYTVYEVIGWRALHGRRALSVSNRAADARWFGSMPTVIAELRGEGVDTVIDSIRAAAERYPYDREYRLWPGPNSNTFTAFIGRNVPELRLDLPPTAIGKDYLEGGDLFAAAPSGTGFQVSLFGLFGVLVAVEEGVEVNLLGLIFGIDPLGPALKLPGFGRVGR